MRTNRSIALRWVVCGVLAAAGGGCSTTFSIRQYPPDFDPAIKTVGVLEFNNDSLQDRAGEVFARQVAAALRANGTYDVLGPAALRAKAAGAGVQLPDEAPIEEIAARLRTVGGVDAILVGTVESYHAQTSSWVDFEPHWGYWGYHGWGRRHRWGVRTGWAWPYAQRRYRTEARVVADAVLVRVADAETIAATRGPVSAQLTSDEYDGAFAGDVLAAAARRTVDRIVASVAVVPRKIKVKNDETLRVARPDATGVPVETDRFDSDETELLLVVRLPAAADRNRFTVSIHRRGEDEPIVAERFVWSAAERVRTFLFSPHRLAAVGGTKKYEARLAGTGTEAVKRKFEIRGRAVPLAAATD
jgi:hypothetical protein